MTTDIHNADIDLRTIFSKVRRQRRIVYFVFVLNTACALLFLALAKPQYTATALLQVSPNETNLMQTGSAIARSSGSENAQIDSEVEILRSDAIALSVFNELGLAFDAEYAQGDSLKEKIGRAIGTANATASARTTDPVDALQKLKAATDIRRRGLTYLISVSATSGSPEKAALIANTFADTYVRQQVQRKVETALASGKILENQIDNARQALAISEARLRDHMAPSKQYGSTASEGPANSSTAQLAVDGAFAGQVDFYALQQETIVAKNQYQTMLTRLRNLETEAAIQIADSQIISAALEPFAPSFPDVKLTILATLFVSLVAGTTLAFINDYFVGAIVTPDQLDEILQTPTLASIPKSDESLSDRSDVAEKILDAPLSPYSESIRKLRAGLDQSFRQRPISDDDSARGNIVLVTSAQEGEGKSTTALALARTYALGGKRALLIDADLRRPSLHSKLGLNVRMGLMEYLRNPEDGKEPPSFFARDPMTSLGVVLGARNSDTATDHLLGSATFSEMIKQAVKVYDVVIIDTPPVLPVVDAPYIAHLADAVVMIVKWSSTSQSSLRHASMPLRAALGENTTFFGALNMVEEQAADSQYSGYLRS